MAIWKGPHNLSQGSKGDFTARLDDKVASLASWLMEVNTLSQGLLPRTGSGGSTVTRMEKTNGLLDDWMLWFSSHRHPVGSDPLQSYKKWMGVQTDTYSLRLRYMTGCLGIQAGQIIATSQDLTPNGGLVIVELLYFRET